MSDEKKSSWDEPRHAKFTHEEDVAFLRRAIEVSRLSREHGNTPFGAILVNEDKQIVLEQENREITEHICTGHAETSLMEAASRKFDHDYLWQCTLYTTGEPCAMCSGAIYWGNLGRLVYIGRESTLKKYTGDDIRNPTLALPCRAIFACGQKPDMELVGPVPELEEEYMKLHEGFWHPSEE